MISLQVSDASSGTEFVDLHSAFLQSHARQEANIVAGSSRDRDRDGWLDRSALGRRVTNIGADHHRLLVQLLSVNVIKTRRA
jgi:hypothetical protein